MDIEKSTAVNGKLLEFADNGRDLVRDGQPKRLASSEFKLARLLTDNPGTVVTKNMMMTHLYAGQTDINPKIIDVFLCRARKKMGADILQNVWGRGAIVNPEQQDVRRSYISPVQLKAIQRILSLCELSDRILSRVELFPVTSLSARWNASDKLIALHAYLGSDEESRQDIAKALMLSQREINEWRKGAISAGKQGLTATMQSYLPA